jgi:hypothetical protein
VADNNNVKFFSIVRPCLRNKKSKFARIKRNEEGSFLIEVLVAGTILLMLAASAVSHITSLTNLKVQTETRDRALVLMNTLHETMQAAGCGFDIGIAKVETFFVGGTSVQTTPFSRVGSCAFKAISNVSSGNATYQLDEDSNLVFSPNNLASVADFCANPTYGGGKCELGDQDFDRTIKLNDVGIEVKYSIRVRYWFEKSGSTISTNSCATNFSTDPGMPNVIARKLEVSWPNNSTASGVETVTSVRRQNIPADTLAFSSSTRAGVYSGSSVVMNIPMYELDGTIKDNFQVTRLNTAASGGAACVWLPYIDIANSAIKPTFTIGGAPIAFPLGIDALENGAL